MASNLFPLFQREEVASSSLRKRRHGGGIDPTNLSLWNLPLQQQQREAMRAILPPQMTFTSLLNDPLTAEIVEQNDEIMNMIKVNAEELQNKLGEKWRKCFDTVECAAEERVRKKMKEYDGEMERMQKKLARAEELMEHLTFEKNVWQGKARDLEAEMANLRANIMVKSENDLESPTPTSPSASVESSTQVNVQPVMPTCKECGEDEARIMMWPCRHVCVCKRCDPASNLCPVCRSYKIASFEILLP